MAIHDRPIASDPAHRTSQDPDRRPFGGLGLHLALARGALILELLSRRFWPAALVLGLFLAVALLDLLPALPAWLHALLLIAAGLAFLVTTWRGLQGLLWPTSDSVARRLEDDSLAAHRPLSALDDSLAGGRGDRATEALWREHQRRLLARLGLLRAGPPRAVMAAADPWALRSLVGLLLLIGLVMAQDDWRGRLLAAVTPDLAAAEEVALASLDVWINPPAYTEIAPALLDPSGTPSAPAGDGASESAVLKVPVGSTLLAQVQGGRGQPALTIGETRLPFEAISEDSYRLSAEITFGERLTILQDQDRLASWAIEVLPDTAPSVEFLSPPSRTERAVLRLEYGAGDDYGLETVRARIVRIDSPEAAPIELDLPLPGTALRSAESSSYHDLTPHPWAGLAVEITLIAEDAIGQSGESDAVRTVLPERIFNHPVARALIEMRKQLTLDPEARLPVVRGLAEIYRQPDHFFHDLVVALALQIAERRLIHDRSEDAVPQVQQLLWDTALRIEEGELAIAERDLRAIQEKLMQALADGASDEEIQRLMDELEAAIEQFMQALAEQLRDQLAGGEEPQPLPPDTQVMSSQQLREMLDQARDLAQSGARDAARELLAQLREMLENIRAQPFAQMMSEQGQDAFEMMRSLEEMMRRQQELLDRSHQRAQQGQGEPRQGQRGQEGEGQQQAGRPGDQPGGDPNAPGQGQQAGSGGDAALQERLRRELGELMRRLGNALGDIPRPLGRAEQAMREARDALDRGQPGQAIDPQTRALDQLQQGLQDSVQAFMQQMGPGQGQGQGNVGMQQGPGRDPLGRQTGSGGIEALEGVEIPDRMEIRRAREILDELRRRRDQRNRPPAELDYIDRLLQQF